MGRGCLSGGACAILVYYCLVAFCVGSTVRAGDHIVGGSTGWTIPTSNASFYQSWAEMRHFVVGDKLVFLFTTGVHNVLEVTESQFGACTHSFDSRGYFAGPAIVRLSSPGSHYFICGVGEHCGLGLKLNVTVDPAADDLDNKTRGAILYESSSAAITNSSQLLYHLLFLLLLLFSSSFLNYGLLLG